MTKKILCCVLVALMVLTMLPLSAGAKDELKNTDPEKYYVLLDTKNQYVTVYEKDDNGEYTRIVRRFICSSGNPEPKDPEDPEDKGSPTPSGIWKAGGRERFGKFAAFGAEYARYWTQIVGGNYFHSVMFSARDVNKLKGGAYGSLGRAVSHGCVRLYIEDAKWLYYYICPGTTIEVSHNEKSDGATRKALKSTVPFKTYNELQKKFYDDAEEPNDSAWVVYDKAEMRTGNGSNDRVVRKVEKGEAVEILQTGDPWCKVKYDGREGYMRLAYLTFTQGTVNSKEDADILKETARMYSQPDKDSEQICKVPKYCSVKVLEQAEGWTKIEYWDEQGWVQANMMTTGWGVIKD